MPVTSAAIPEEPRWKLTCWKCPDASQPAVYAPAA